MILNWLFSVVAIGVSAILTISFARPGLSTFAAYFDFNAFVITVVFPLIFQWALFGLSGLKMAFLAGFRNTASMEDLKRSRLFFSSYAQVIWLSVLLPVIIGTVAILKWVTPDDYTLMGPNFAMALMSFLYAVVIHAAIILPCSVILRRKIIELNIEI
ncbi:MAG: hypothetical protein LBL45_05900 [Treponema sp.]|jgi:hypothetical protein|nr:hypothetical protein [Treponema sp.]